MRKPRLGTILLMLWGLFLSAAVYGYLTWLQPSRLASTVSHMLESKLDVQCRIGAVSLSLLPFPTIHASDLSLLRGSVDDMELHVRKAEIRIGFLSLLRLKPTIRFLLLENPTLDMSSDLLRSHTEKKQTTGANEDPGSLTIPSLPSGIVGVRIHIVNGTWRLTGGQGKDHLICSGINASARLPGLIPGTLELTVDAIRYTNASGLDLSASNSHLSLSSLRQNHRGIWSGGVLFSSGFQLASLDTVMGYPISAPYRYFPMPEPLSLSMTGEFSAIPEQNVYTARGTTKASAMLVMNGHPVPISLSVPFELQDLAKGLTLTNVDARMGDDHVTISGNVTGLTAGVPVLNGRADIHHFSLTRWFGFGQAMNQGLQHALDSITGSFEDMELSPYGIVVPRLHAQVQGIDLEGSGSCREFLKPEILISAHARQADLNRIFPELHGEYPDMSHMPPPVLPLSPDDETSTEPPLVRYDIHISADNADIMNFRVSGADVHVVPAPAGHPMLNIAVSGVYGGRATSTVHLEDKVTIDAMLERVSMDGLTRALAGYAAITGVMKKGVASLSFAPGSGVTMLSSLGGKVNVSMEQGALTLEKQGSSLPYTSLSISAQANASPAKTSDTMPPLMDFRGAWKVDLASKSGSVSAEAKQAVLAFNTKTGIPTTMRNQPVVLQIVLPKESCGGIFTEDMKFSVSGKGSYNTDNGTASLSDATLRHTAFTLAGSLSASDLLKKTSVTGKLSFTTASLRKCAALLGLSLPSTSGDMLRKAEAEAQLTLSSQLLSLENLSGNIDGTLFNGDVHQTLTGRSTLNGKLDVASLDIDRYLPKKASTESAKSSSPLPLSLLKSKDISLSLYVERLRAFSTTLTRASLPVSQKNGSLSVPIKASFPGGGQVNGKFQAELSADSTSATLSLTAHCRDMNMLNFSRDRGQKTLISGTGTFDAQLQSHQKFWEDWKRTLNGKLSFFVSNGAIITQTASHNETKKESRTDFKTMSMSIALNNGIATCRDFLIKGSPVAISGGGTVNLATESIDANATVTLAGIPEMPLSITGNLFSPKVSYKLLGAVTGTVGNLGSGVIDLVGGLLSAPFKLFMK